MARFPVGLQLRRYVLDLADPAFDGVLAFAAAAYPEVPTTRALRELLLLAVAQNPDVAARGAAYRTALAGARRIVFDEAGRALAAAADRIGVEAAAAMVLDMSDLGGGT